MFRCPWVVWLAVVLVLPAAIAHEGDPGGIILDGALQGEAYDVADASCDPDFDGEHTYPQSYSDGSGPRHVFMPHSGCGVLFEEVDFQGDAYVGTIWYLVGGTGSSMTYELRVYIDGLVHASGTRTSNVNDGFGPIAFTPGPVIPAGSHSVRLEYVVTSGPSYANIRIDRVTFEYTDTDTDHDGLPDAWEQFYFGDLDEDGEDDADRDDLDNRAEWDHGTDPTDPYTDNDCLGDGAEIRDGSDPKDRSSMAVKVRNRVVGPLELPLEPPGRARCYDLIHDTRGFIVGLVP